MEKNSTAAARDARPRVVIDFDDQIVKPVGTAKPVAWFIGRPPEWLVITAILGVFTPSDVGTDSPDR